MGSLGPTPEHGAESSRGIPLEALGTYGDPMNAH